MNENSNTAPADGSDLQDKPLEIDVSLFDWVLQADLINIINRAKATGTPLTQRQREMIEEARTNLQKTTAAAAFTLEGEGAMHALERMTQRELAEAWGYSLRQLKNWLADGRAAGDPAPVTRPAEMAAWFRRVYAPRECPDKLGRAIQRLLSEGVERKPAESNGGHAAPGTMVQRVEVSDSEKGLLAMLDRYRTAEVSLHNKYMAAVDEGDENRSQFLLSEWSKMGEKVRSLEKTAPKALEELRIYVRRDSVQRELESLHAAILKAFRQEFRLARVKLKSAGTAEEWGKCVDETVEKVATMLVETEFAEPLELQVA